MSRRNHHGGRNWKVKGDSEDGWVSRLLHHRYAERVAAVVGVLSLAGAVAVAASPAGGRLAADLSGFLLGDRVVVGALAAVGALLGVLAVLPETDDEEGVALPSKPDPDEKARAVVGRDFEEKVDLFSNAASVDGLWESYDVRGQLRDLGVEVLAGYADYDREGASAALDDGSWTDDPRAAAFLGQDLTVPLRLGDVAGVDVAVADAAAPDGPAAGLSFDAGDSATGRPFDADADEPVRETEGETR